MALALYHTARIWRFGLPDENVTFKKLGGAFDLVFGATTIKEIASLSQQRGIETEKAHDQSHLGAMWEMQLFTNDP